MFIKNLMSTQYFKLAQKIHRNTIILYSPKIWRNNIPATRYVDSLILGGWELEDIFLVSILK